MARWWPALMLGCLLTATNVSWQHPRPAEAGTVLLPGTQAEVDDKTVKELMEVFDRAEQAVQKRDLEGVMAVYSKHYNYHGLKKPDIRKIWANLFENYREIESTHLFSRIVAVPGGNVEITCSGGVRGMSKTGNLRVPIDSWYGEVHYMVKEDGTWKIRGNLGDVQTVLPFGTAPHPLF